MLFFFKNIPARMYVFAVFAMLVLSGYAYVSHLQHEVFDIQMQRDSVEAASSLTIKRDSVTWTKRVMQVQFEADSVDRLLKSRSAVRAKIVFQTDTIHDSTTATGTRGADSSMTYAFNKRSEPYTLDAKVVADGTTAKLDFTIKQDPLRIGARIECGKTVNGVSPATIVLLVPKFITANVDSVSQSKEVCSSTGTAGNTGISRTRAYAELGVGVGALIAVKKFVLPLLGWK